MIAEVCSILGCYISANHPHIAPNAVALDCFFDNNYAWGCGCWLATYGRCDCWLIHQLCLLLSNSIDDVFCDYAVAIFCDMEHATVYVRQKAASDLEAEIMLSIGIRAWSFRFASYYIVRDCT